jgi:NTP pyrophosphatase (non-canonical NTP hydrolase)
MKGPNPTTIAELQHAIRVFCEERDWDRFHGAKDLAIGIASEAGELLQLFRFLSDDEVEALFRRGEDRSRVEAELADVLIFVLRLAQRYDIDLPNAVQRKLDENGRRYPVEASRGSNRKVAREG